MVTCLPALGAGYVFPPLPSVACFPLNSDWFLFLFAFALIGHSDYFGLGYYSDYKIAVDYSLQAGKSLGQRTVQSAISTYLLLKLINGPNGEFSS